MKNNASHANAKLPSIVLRRFHKLVSTLALSKSKHHKRNSTTSFSAVFDQSHQCLVDRDYNLAWLFSDTSTTAITGTRFVVTHKLKGYIVPYSTWQGQADSFAMFPSTDASAMRIDREVNNYEEPMGHG